MGRSVNVSRSATDDWEEAMVSGNGRQGALCYGSPGRPRITLSHERLFLPAYPPLDPPETARILPELRLLLSVGRYRAAAERAQAFAAAGEPGYATTRPTDPFVGAGTLTFVPRVDGPARDYRREVDFTTGVVTQRWTTDAGEATVRVFVSRPADVVVVDLAGLPDGQWRLGPIDGTPPLPVDLAAESTVDCLRLRASYPDAPGGWTVTVRLVTAGGRVTLLLARTEVDGFPSPGPDLADLPADGEKLLAEHAAVHGDLFGRVRLDLHADATRRTADTEDLLARPTAGTEHPNTAPATRRAASLGPSSALAVDAATVERLFDAGRYAIVSSCGELPPNLQGVWSGTYQPAWSGDYTLDGNLPAAVAGLLPTGTPELMLPLFDLLDGWRGDFRRNARRLYGASGILVPAHASTHGLHNHFGPVWCLTFWTAGAAWLGRLYLDYYRYTGDREFLAGRALPFLREAAAFYRDFLNHSARPAAAVVFTPSYSPENRPGSSDSQAAVNATMDVAAVADLLRGLLATTEELGQADPDAPAWRALLAQLPAHRVTADGELAEWIWPGLAENHAHRHASHLYPLWYELDPAFAADPVLRAAAARTIGRRLAWWRSTEADEMAFGLVQLGLAAAQLGLAEPAYEALTRLARYWRPSLVATHNLDRIFNVDICGGLPALVVAMLLRSARDSAGHSRLDLLPALPAAWPSGELRGAAARGPVRVERLAWSPDRVEAVLVPGYSGDLTVGLPDGVRQISVRHGRPITLTAKR